ncbi:acyl carrier protein [Flavobacterium galactosidilyticum]|uniref:acyl carrier protein n=1 Tax=Flavobacterium galactosidilyticum TaxID=2893886 RepID=UPI001E4D15B1|nr:acyl carrier protein [Flavobacterium sp. F-340]UFH46671.1 acyl carrier protein [Flavobacterium sp. F-340]
MTAENFIKELQEEVFMETEISLMTLETNFKDLDEWDSLTALSLIAHFDFNLGKKLSGDQIKNAVIIQELYNIATA